MLFVVGQNPAVSSPNLRVVFDGAGQPRHAGGAGDLGDRDGRLLEAARRRPQVHQHRGAAAAGRLLHGEERIHRELRRDGAVAIQDGRAAGTGEDRRRDHRHGLPQGARPGRRLDRTAGRPDPEGLLAIRDRRGPAPGDQRTGVSRPCPARSSRQGDLVSKVADLQPDGSTSSGCWIYAGVFSGGKNLTKRRDSRHDPSGLGLYPEFAWTWPNNMRILYNRASCDRHGKPYPGLEAASSGGTRRPGRWTGHDVPDVPEADRRPQYAERPTGLPPERRGRRATVRGGLRRSGSEDIRSMPRDASYVPKDGPLPEMYEPVESPFENSMHPGQRHNPTLKYPRVREPPPDRHGRQVPARAHDLDRRRTLVLRFDHAKRLVADRDGA